MNLAPAKSKLEIQPQAANKDKRKRVQRKTERSPDENVRKRPKRGKYVSK